MKKLIAILLLSGCATGQGVARGLLRCAPEVARSVQGAIESGGSSWIDLVIAGIECVPQVVAEIDRARDSGVTNAPPEVGVEVRRRSLVATQLLASYRAGTWKH